MQSDLDFVKFELIKLKDKLKKSIEVNCRLILECHKTKFSILLSYFLILTFDSEIQSDAILRQLTSNDFG